LLELSLTGIEFFFGEPVCFLASGSVFSFSEDSSLLGTSSYLDVEGLDSSFFSDGASYLGAAFFSSLTGSYTGLS
jgi:hypothetical protein